MLAPDHNPSIWKVEAGRPESQHNSWKGSDFEAILENMRPFVKEIMKYKESVCEGAWIHPFIPKNLVIWFYVIKDTSEMWVPSE